MAAPANNHRRLFVLALAGVGGIAIGATFWGWVRYGDAIYLDRMLTAVANCF